MNIPAWGYGLIAAAVAVGIIIAVQNSNAHPVAVVGVPIAKAVGGGSIGGAGAGVSIGAAAAVGVIGFAAGAAVVDLMKKKCNRSHDTWVDTRHDVIPPVQPRRWRDPCKRHKYRAADPVKSIWPNGK